MVTPNTVSDVLHIPRVAHPNYLGCDHLKIVSKDELISTFYECPSDWGDRQFTLCLAFAKGPRFLNMVMTFVLHPLSHYNSMCLIFAFSFKASHYRYSLLFHSFYHKCTYGYGDL